MYNRIEVPLTASPAAGLVAAGPWLLLLAASLALAVTVHPLTLAGSPLLLAGAFDRWRRCGSLRHPRAVIRLAVIHRTLLATLGSGRELEVSVVSGSRIGGDWLVLGLRGTQPARDFPVVLTSATGFGNTNATALRRLRVWLRLMPEAAAPIPAAAWSRNSLQTPWPGGKSHVRDIRQ